MGSQGGQPDQGICLHARNQSTSRVAGSLVTLSAYTLNPSLLFVKDGLPLCCANEAREVPGHAKEKKKNNKTPQLLCW